MSYTKLCKVFFLALVLTFSQINAMEGQGAAGPSNSSLDDVIQEMLAAFGSYLSGDKRSVNLKSELINFLITGDQQALEVLLQQGYDVFSEGVRQNELEGTAEPFIMQLARYPCFHQLLLSSEEHVAFDQVIPLLLEYGVALSSLDYESSNESFNEEEKRKLYGLSSDLIYALAMRDQQRALALLQEIEQAKEVTSREKELARAFRIAAGQGFDEVVNTIARLLGTNLSVELVHEAAVRTAVTGRVSTFNTLLSYNIEVDVAQTYIFMHKILYFASSQGRVSFVADALKLVPKLFFSVQPIMKHLFCLIASQPVIRIPFKELRISVGLGSDSNLASRYLAIIEALREFDSVQRATNPINVGMPVRTPFEK